jgi:hypothetical protein
VTKRANAVEAQSRDNGTDAVIAALTGVLKLLVVDATNRDIVARVGDQRRPWCCATTVYVEAKVIVGGDPDCLVGVERPALTK